MKVNSINNITPNFKAIYKQSNAAFTPEQESIMHDLEAQLQSDKYKDAQGRTLEQRYEQKNEHFFFTPSSKGANFVHLGMLVNPKTYGTNLLTRTSSDAYENYIGDFNKNNTDLLINCINDREERAQEDLNLLGGCLKYIVLPLVFTLGICLSTNRCNRGSEKHIEKTVQVAKDTFDKKGPAAISLMK